MTSAPAVTELHQTFDAKAYHDEYRERVMELIEEKSKGVSRADAS